MSAITGTSQTAARTVDEAALPTSGTVAVPAAVSVGIATVGGALYRSLGAAVFPSGASGLRLPQNAEDAAILLAEAAVAIDAARRAASDARITGAAAAVRGSLGGAAAQIALADTKLYGVGQAGGGLIDQRAAAVTERNAAVARDAVLAGQITRLEVTVATLDAAIATERTSAAAAIRALSAERDTQAARLALIDTRILAAQAAQDPSALAALRAERATIAAALAATVARIDTTRTASEARIAALSGQRDAASAELGAARAERATVQARITELDGTITGLDAAIAAAERDAVLGRTALIVAFAQMTALFQDRSGERALEHARSTELDQRLDEAGQALKDLRERMLVRFEADVRASDDLRDAQASERILAALLGLTAGLADVADVLRREAETPPDDVRIRRQMAL